MNRWKSERTEKSWRKSVCRWRIEWKKLWKDWQWSDSLFVVVVVWATRSHFQTIIHHATTGKMSASLIDTLHYTPSSTASEHRQTLSLGFRETPRHTTMTNDAWFFEKIKNKRGSLNSQLSVLLPPTLVFSFHFPQCFRELGYTPT